MDTVSARAIVRVKKLTAPKDVATAGELSSKTSSRPNISTGGSTLAARLLQQKARIAKAQEAETASKTTDDLTGVFKEVDHSSHDAIAVESLLPFATDSRSVSPVPEVSEQAGTRLKLQAQSESARAADRGNKQMACAQPTQLAQQHRQPIPAGQQADQHAYQVKNLQTLLEPCSTVVTHEGNKGCLGPAGAPVAPGTSEMAAVQAVRSLQPKKRGRPSIKDKKAVADKLIVGEQYSSGFNGAVWQAHPQQYSQPPMLAASAQPLQKQRRKPGRPPKAVTAAAGVISPMLAQQRQQYSDTGRSSSAGDGHRISLDEPYRGSGWPTAPAPQIMGSYQQYAEQTAAAAAWPEAASASTTGHGISGMRTRLSIRSVAYLEDLLEQTAQAAATEGHPGAAGDPQITSKPVNKGVTLPAITAGSGRLSVRSIIVSPPLSRSTSMHPAATSSPPKEPAPGSVVPCNQSSAGQAAMLSHPVFQAVAATSALQPGDNGAADAPASGGLDPAKQSACYKRQQPDRAMLQLLAGTSSIAGSCHQQKAVDQALPSDAAVAPGAPGVTASTPAACTTWQLAADTACKDPRDEVGSSSGDESDVDKASTWTESAPGDVAEIGADAAKHGRPRRPSLDSDTSSPPSSGPAVYGPSLLGPFSGSNAACLNMAPGLLHGGLLQGYGANIAPPLQGMPSSATASGAVGYVSLPNPRKSDRQLGLETVQRIDAIFQQSRSLQAGHLSSCAPGHVPADSTAVPAAQGRSSIPAEGNTAADRRESISDERCSVAALCRGLRFDGDITLKEVALAFQLRDAYDWDEDLEAAGKECKASEDPRLKGPKLLSSSPSLSNSSVCPDPEPVPGFLPRSKWMAGNGREGVSPVVAAQMGLPCFQHSQEFHPGAVAVGLAPTLLHRLHQQSYDVSSQLGSVNSSRRASLAGSPVDVPGHHSQQQQGVPNPAVLHAAISAAARQQQRVKGWAASIPGMDAQTEQHGLLQQVDMQTMQPYACMPLKMPGRGGRGRKRKHADDSDDDYDPRKPSHQHELYQRRTVDRRAQQQYYQQRLYSRLSRYEYSYQAMQQAYSAATMQHAYVVQAASRSGAPLSMQQVQQLQQLQCMQQHAQLAMAAMEEQAAAAAAVGDMTYGVATAADDIGEAAALLAPSTSFKTAAATRLQEPSKDSLTHNPADLVECSGQQQQQQEAALVHQHPHGADQSQLPVDVEQQSPKFDAQPAQSQRQGYQTQQQQVRRPSYVKRRLTADDAADWLQSHAQDGLQFCRQPGFSRLSSHTSSLLMSEEQDQGLRIVSPTAVQLPPAAAGCNVQPSSAAPAIDRPLSRNSSRVRRRTLVGLQYDALYGASAEASGKSNSEEGIEPETDMSEADIGQSTGLKGGRRGAYGGRARGRGGRGRGRGAVAGGAAGISKPPNGQPAGTATAHLASHSEPVGVADSGVGLTVSDGSPAQHVGLPSGARGRGRGRATGRGRLGVGRGRSCLGSAPTQSKPVTTAPAAAEDGRPQLNTEGTKHSTAASGVNTALLTSQGVAGVVDTAAAASLAVRNSFETVAGAARGRGRGRGRGSAAAASADPARNSNPNLGSVAGTGRGAPAAGRRGRGSSRGRGRIGRPSLSSNTDGQMTAAAEPAKPSAADTLHGAAISKRQRVDTALSNAFFSSMPSESADDDLLPPLSTRSLVPVDLHQGGGLSSTMHGASPRQSGHLNQQNPRMTGQQEQQYHQSSQVSSRMLSYVPPRAHGSQEPAGQMPDIDLMANESPLS